jgi:hypothetical protein
MIMADVFTVTFIILGFWLAIPALCLVLRACFPEAFGRAQLRLREAPYWSFFTGLGVGALGVVGVSLLGSIPGIGQPGAGLAGSLFFLLSLLGAGAFGTFVGERLPSPFDEARPWLPTVRGTVLLAVSCTVPFLGWFVLLPVTLSLGLGAGFGAWRGRGSGGSGPPKESSLEAEETPEDAGSAAA